MRQLKYFTCAVLLYFCTEVRSDFTCPPGEEGFFAPDGQCSSEYYACINGIAYPKTCPDGEVFDPVNKHCVPYEQASCRDTIYTTSTTTAGPRETTLTTTKATTSTSRPSQFSCPSPDGTFPIPGECTSDYYVCIANYPYATRCPNGNIFDPVTLVCTPPDQASCTSTFTCPSLDGFFPIPGACTSQYYICVGGVPSLTECPVGAIFDPQTLSCVLPESASCSKQ